MLVYLLIVNLICALINLGAFFAGYGICNGFIGLSCTVAAALIAADLITSSTSSK